MTSVDRDKVKCLKTYQLIGHTHHDGPVIGFESRKEYDYNVGLLVSASVPPISLCIIREVTI